LPFTQVSATEQPGLRVWIGGVRPILMLSYWLNFAWSGFAPFSYHLFNILVHTANAFLVFVVVYRLFAIRHAEGATRFAFSIFAAFLFLCHPLQTEAVSYIAGRSESLGALFFLAAWCLYIYRSSDSISWKRSIAVLALYAMAVATKENMI